MEEWGFCRCFYFGLFVCFFNLVVVQDGRLQSNTLSLKLRIGIRFGELR